MSKKPLKTKKTFDPSGMTWQEVIEFDPTHVRGISLKSFAKMTSRLVSAYNKRAKRLEQSGLAEASPAYRGIAEDKNTRLSVKGKNFNELVSTYAYAKRLLTERSTFSVAGTRAMMKKTAQRIGHEFKSKEESQRFWEAVDKLKEKDIGNDKTTSTDTQREVSEMMFNEGASVEEVLEHYNVIVEANTPSLSQETNQIYGFGEEDEDEDEGDGFSLDYDEEDTPW